MVRDREATLRRLAGDGPRIHPSLLNCDFGILSAEIADAQRCGAAAVHWDVMDGDFVPNFTYGPPIIKSLRSSDPMVFDAHLMMSRPERYIDAFLDAGCDIITVHLEAAPLPGELLERIRNGGALAGLAINPETPIEKLGPHLTGLDLALIMSVHPGFGGQKFDPGALDKLRWTRERAAKTTLIEVDGGINQDTISDVVAAGARLMVVGSAFYSASDRKAAWDTLTQHALSGASFRG